MKKVDKEKYNKQYYQDNCEKILKRQKQYYKNHREEEKKRSEKWRENNLEKSRKINMRSYKKYREKRTAHLRQSYKERRKYIDDYKLSKGCSICNYNKYAVALVFHHNGNKEFNVSKIVLYSLKRLKKEMEKCEILCRNCHAILHEEERRKK